VTRILAYISEYFVVTLIIVQSFISTIPETAQHKELQ